MTIDWHPCIQDLLFTLTRVPTAQGKQGKCPKNSLSGKTQGIWKCCQNTGKNTGDFVKIQGILFVFCSSGKCSDSKSKGQCNICCKKITFFSRSWIGLPSQFCVCNSHKLCKLARGKFAVRQGKNWENTGNLSGYPA